jgi:hypothetical protein
MNIKLNVSTIAQQDKFLTSNQDSNFEITLSVTPQTVFTKKAGETLTAFQLQTYNSSDTNAISGLLTSRCYSTNTWNGSCAKETYVGMTGVTLDFDHDITIEEAKTRFQEFNCILHTTTSHQAKEPYSDRFRVILPFAPGVIGFTAVTNHEKVYRKLLIDNPEADSGCKDTGRKFFPHSDDLGSEFILYVNSTGKYFDVDISDVPELVLKPKRVDYLPSEELGTKEELQRVQKFCPFIQWCIANGDAGLPEPLWYAMISNLCRFDGGKELIHEISAADPVPGRYDLDQTEEKIQQAMENSNPIGYDTIVSWGWPGKAPEKPYSPAGWGKLGRILNRKPFGKNQELHITYDDTLIIQNQGQWQATDLASLKVRMAAELKKIKAICPFCDSETATIQNDTFNFTSLSCTNCNKEAFEYPVAPNVFTYKNEILRVEQREEVFSSIEVMARDHFRNDDEYYFARKLLLNRPERKFLDDNFQVRRVGSADFSGLKYEFDIKQNSLVHKYPAIPVQVEDNAFVDGFLDTMFGVYEDFIKNWMAMFTYTNYVTLPVIVLQGERGCGKGTFAQVFSVSTFGTNGPVLLRCKGIV